MASQKKLRDIKGIRGLTYRLDQLEQRASYALNGIRNFRKLQNSNGSSRPLVAAVVVGRNDDYMPDFAERLFVTIEWNLRHFVTEVVFVEWNPLPDRPLLSIALAERFKCLRGYIVSPELHQATCQSPGIPLLEFHAKNVGIRRAQSPWIVVTNGDAAFAPASVLTILNSPINQDQIWTAQRIDVAWPIGRTKPFGPLDCLGYKRKIPYTRYGTGEFAFASRALWHKIRGYDETMVRHRLGCDTRGVAQMLWHGATSQKAGHVFHLEHPTSCTETSVPELSHGETAPLNNLPYQNPDSWGLADRREVEVAERVWRLE